MPIIFICLLSFQHALTIINNFMDLKSGFPFSLIKNGLLHNYASLKESGETEIVILEGKDYRYYQLIAHRNKITNRL